MQPHRLDIAGVFRRVFEIYRDQAGLFLPVALAVFLPVAILSALAQGGVASSIVFGLLAAVLSLIATYAYQGMVVETVRDVQDGVRDSSIGDLFRSVVPVLPVLIGASILAGLAIGIGLILLIVPGLVLLTWWAVIAPSIVLERTGLIDAFGRSRNLVRGHGWQVFGVIAGVLVLQIVLSLVVTGLVAIFADNAVGNAVASLLTNTLVAPVSATAAAVLFLELRRLRGEAPLSAGAEAGRVAAPGAAVPGGVQEGAAHESSPSQPGTPLEHGQRSHVERSPSGPSGAQPPEGGAPPQH